ncbi:helix-turn-helix domain-containing protein [Actinophytocola sediminis]
MNIDDAHIGSRVRQIRHWRGMSLTATAGLAGMSHAYLSMIERGLRPVTKRSTLEALAKALRVSPADLSDKPWERAGDSVEGQVNLAGLVSALDAFELGEDPGENVREWPEVEADVRLSEELNHLRADFVRLADLLPKLLGELHALYVRKPVLREQILLALIQVYKQIVAVTRNYNGGNEALPLLAAMAAQRCAEELGQPQWRAMATWQRCLAAGAVNRPQQYRRAVRMAEELVPLLDNPEVLQAYGMLHLSAALAAAAQSDRSTAFTHLDEAGGLADRQEAEVGRFAMMWFGRTNVRIWRVSIGLELGEGAKVAETARGIHLKAIPSQKRHADFYADIGRGLLTEKHSRSAGLELLLRAEKLAPQKFHANMFVREAVADLLRVDRREAGGRELRGLAYRMGVAP